MFRKSASEEETMFDLENAIRQWKKTLAANPGLEDGQRTELEACLRDEISDLVSQGITPEEAFSRVSKEMGSPDAMCQEFFKVYAKTRFGPPIWMQTRFVPALLWNYVKVTLRKIRRQKGYSVINTASLAVGISCCTVMLLWVRNERSFDRFHTNGDSIYRVIKKTKGNDGTMFDARTPYPLSPAIREKVPEVLNFSRYQGFENPSLKYRDVTINIPDFLGTADPSFFEMFTFPFVEGDPKTALTESRSIILTESMSRRIFGEESPMGEILTYLGGWGDFKVTGVMRDIPENSHIRFDAMVPIKDIAPGKHVEENDWEPLFFYSYVQLTPHGSTDSAASKIAAVLNENIPHMGADILLQPLKDVHLKSYFQWDLDNYAQGSESTLTIFTLAALGILFLAMINFMNLSTARSANRAKEIGLRKVSGAQRIEVMVQFFGESLVHAFLGLFLALILVQAVLPLFNSLAEKAIVFTDLFEPQLVLILLGLTLFTGFFSGAYPAFFLSAFQPAKVLKGESVSGGHRQTSLRKSLVVIQFALTLFLVMGTAVVDRQLRFVRDKNLGIDTNNVVTFLGPFRDIQAAKSTLLTNPNILSITRCDPPQREQRGRSDVTWEGKNPMDETQFFPVTVDPDYLETFRIGLTEGRFFSYDFPTDSTDALVLNETAVRGMGLTSVVGKRITVGEHPYTVIGIVKDFHQSSLHRPIEPMIFTAPEFYHTICARIRPIQVDETLAFIEETSKRMDPRLAEMPFHFGFLDERIDAYYKVERKVEAILGLFTSIALFTACLGLFGLASFLAEKRTKEIGIRKVLGAPVLGLVFLQTREFTKWIFLSGLVAGPAAYYASGRWLRGFAYHINPGFGLYLITLLATLLVAFLAVGFQSVRAARANPVDSLRYE
jgi:putative ABC transport system permease protein